VTEGLRPYRVASSGLITRWPEVATPLVWLKPSKAGEKEGPILGVMRYGMVASLS
jgi:hypothetical protein